MASKLLNVLNDIENGREKIVNTLKYKGYPLNDNSSFNEIGTILDDVEDTKNHKTYIPYYELTPETDPELWHYPSDWPDIEAIFREQEDIEIDGKRYYPLSMFLFSEGLNTNTFVFPSSLQSDAQATLEEGYVSLPYTYGGYGDNWGSRKILKFSDGTISEPFNDVASNNQYIKNWDASKDIVVNDGEHLRWVVVYIQESSNTSTFYGYNLTNLNTKVFLTTKPFMGRNSATQNEQNLGVNEDFKMLIFTDPKTPLGILRKSGYISSGVFLNKLGGLRYLKINVDDKTFCPNTIFSNATSNKVTQYFCNTNNAVSLNALNNLKYMYVSQFNGAGINSSVRYLYVDNVVSDTISFNYMYSLIDTNIFEKLTTFNAINHSFHNVKVLSLPNVISLSNTSALMGVRCDTLIMENLKNNAGNFSSAYLRKVVVPKLEILNGTIGENVIYLDISGCKTIIATNLASSNSSLEYIDASSLETCNINCFNNLPRLKQLILPNDFKNSLYLNGCNALPSNEIINIFNKLADVRGETSTYTIYINSMTKVLLTDEEIAIATNKGWVVQ